MEKSQDLKSKQRMKGGPATRGKVVGHSKPAAVNSASNSSGPRVLRASNTRRTARQGTEAKYYQVEFKEPRTEIFVGYDNIYEIGDMVKVEADRGEDLGKLVAIWEKEDFEAW